MKQAAFFGTLVATPRFGAYSEAPHFVRVAAKISPWVTRSQHNHGHVEDFCRYVIIVLLAYLRELMRANKNDFFPQATQIQSLLRRLLPHSVKPWVKSN